MKIMSTLHSCFDSSPRLNDFQFELQRLVKKYFVKFVVNGYLIVILFGDTGQVTKYKNLSVANIPGKNVVFNSRFKTIGTFCIYIGGRVIFSKNSGRPFVT